MNSAVETTTTPTMAAVRCRGQSSRAKHELAWQVKLFWPPVTAVTTVAASAAAAIKACNGPSSPEPADATSTGSTANIWLESSADWLLLLSAVIVSNNCCCCGRNTNSNNAAAAMQLLPQISLADNKWMCWSPWHTGVACCSSYLNAFLCLWQMDSLARRVALFGHSLVERAENVVKTAATLPFRLKVAWSLSMPICTAEGWREWACLQPAVFVVQ